MTLLLLLLLLLSVHGTCSHCKVACVTSDRVTTTPVVSMRPFLCEKIELNEVCLRTNVSVDDIDITHPHINMPMIFIRVVCIRYFQRRLQRWDDPPIQYQFVAVQLKKPVFVTKVVLPLLTTLLGDSDDADTMDPHASSLDRVVAVRAYQSLVALRAMQPECFKDGPGAEVAARLDRIAAAGRVDEWKDAVAIQHEQILAAMVKGKTGLLQLGDRVAAYVHERGCPRWGPLRLTEAAAIGDRLAMLDGVRNNNLLDVLVKLDSIPEQAPPPVAPILTPTPSAKPAKATASVDSKVSKAHSELNLFD